MDVDLITSLKARLSAGEDYDDLADELISALDSAAEDQSTDDARDEFISAILTYLFKTGIFPESLTISEKDITELKSLLAEFEASMRKSGIPELLKYATTEEEEEDEPDEDESIQKILELLGIA